MTTLTISLPDTMTAFIESQLSNKGYGDISEYIRSLLHDAQVRDENARLEALLLEGLDTESLPLDNAFWNRLETKTEAIMQKHAPRALP